MFEQKGITGAQFQEMGHTEILDSKALFTYNM